MTRHPFHQRTAPLFLVLAVLASPFASEARAQATPPPARAAGPSRSIEIGGYAMVGRINFASAKSFDAILGESSGTILGGGARVGLPFGGLFVDVGAWTFRDEGERVFVADDQVIPLGIPVKIIVTPIELGAGWRFKIPKLPKLIPYAGGGLTFMNYTETSDFSGTGEDVAEAFNGYHVIGGAEFKITRWLGVAGEAAWTTVPDAIGEGGVSKAFDENELGGTTFRFKVTIGR